MAIAAASPAAAQLRIVDYNTMTAQNPGTQTARPETATVFQAIAAEAINGIAKPIDVLLLQEQFTTAITTQSFVDMLNGIYGAGTYARSTIDALVSDFDLRRGGGPAMVYNTQTVQLIEEIRFGTVNGSAQPRSSMRYRLRPVGYDASADFFAYNDHYKAEGGEATDPTRRQIEAQAVRANADALGQGAHIIYAGDYNIETSAEAMFQTLIAAGNGQAMDPLNASGTPGSPVTWRDNSAYRGIHTQDPDGPMDDRFDFQLVSQEMLDNEGMSVISGSYHAFGNNGTHTLNGAITTGTGASPAVLSALRTASDHLPVVVDYQLPAKMDVQFGAVPTMVAVGAVTPIDVMVQNIAAALTVGSVDELDYTVSVTGDLRGGVSSTDFALGGGNLHQIMLNTSTPGQKTGLITVTATSQQAASPLFSLPVSFQVGDGVGPPTLPPNTTMPMLIARDDFDAPLNRLSFTQTPAAGAFADLDDGFQRYQVGVSPTIPANLLDRTTSGSPSDTLGIVVPPAKTDGWFGAVDTDNPQNVGGASTATWQFAIGGASGLAVSIYMGGIGDFEAGADVFNWTYALDGGAFQPLFTSSVNEAGAKTYTLANASMVTHQDPLSMTTTNAQTVELSNVFQTLTSPIAGTGAMLTLRLNANTNGADEAYAFDNIVINGLVSFLASDFDKDGSVDGDDLAAWQAGFGTLSGATKAQGDADNDGDVDPTDFMFWQRQLGAPQPGASVATASVPEPPAALALIAIAAAATSRRRPS